MTSSILRPRGRVRTAAPDDRTADGSTEPTRILDWRHPRVGELLGSLGTAPAGVTAHDNAGTSAGQRMEALRRAHRRIAATVRPVYSVQDERPVSEVLRRGRGSCSQRLAVLEAVARAGGVATRVRGLLVDGALWYPRFPRMRRLVPDHVLLAWPEFLIDPAAGPDGGWLPVSELFGGLAELSSRPGGGFTNAGAETLFEALSRTAIDWDGATACPADAAACDLSAHVVADLGRFDSRDDLFTRHGQTLCRAARLVAEPVMGRRAAGAASAG
ncbi:transglutaminase domain-containing protein [Streptomyces sp. ISL-10]|uniref:transglutaminase domain-containing protein n=1 Tax=Streptomyces sp. ISL-10 TaxID=2819172 RepID=UPI001BE52778|nr:transglutaminase domain-containing protein [Streptomyces sp. ISL-10]MBT2368985.1 transglutaminase domain-containing protein [Streptomyces sp. ISL-10]